MQTELRLCADCVEIRSWGCRRDAELIQDAHEFFPGGIQHGDTSRHDVAVGENRRYGSGIGPDLLLASGVPLIIHAGMVAPVRGLDTIVRALADPDPERRLLRWASRRCPRSTPR